MYKVKLAIITTHPIQYNAPLFNLLNNSREIEAKVFYTWGQSKEKIFDPGFGNERVWDVPLLEGYQYSFVKNTSTDPGSHHFNGIINPSLIKDIEDFSPNSILVYGWSFNSHSKVLRYFKGKRQILFRGDSTMIDETAGMSFKKTIRHIFLKWVYRHVDKALYVGGANKNYYLKLGLKPHQLSFAPHAIDNNRFADVEGSYQQKALQWRQQLGIGAAECVFLFAGKLEPKKNPQLLIDAFNALKDESIHLIIVGNGILEKSLKAATPGNKKVHFIDFQNQSIMPVVYRLGDVFVLPSKGPGETWGLAVNEAMACSRPVLISDKCGCAYDLVREGVNGYIFKSNDKHDLFKKMNFLSGNKNKRAQLGEASLQIIRQWSYQEVCKEIEELLLKS